VLLKNFVDSELEKFRLDSDMTIFKPDVICKRLNNELLREKLYKYLTIFYGIINTKDNKMYYINCGQFPYPFVIDTDKIDEKDMKNSCVTVIEGKGTPVGLFKTPIFRLKEMNLPQRFKMVMFSDGVLEILPQDSLDDKNRYLYSIFNDKDINIDKIKDKLSIEGMTSFPDDLTFFMIEKSS
jgi:serine phosphatase RsbU (regulator of sigma subunit)